MFHWFVDPPETAMWCLGALILGGIIIRKVMSSAVKRRSSDSGGTDVFFGDSVGSDSAACSSDGGDAGCD